MCGTGRFNPKVEPMTSILILGAVVAAVGVLLWSVWPVQPKDDDPDWDV